jgi:putative transposase
MLPLILRFLLAALRTRRSLLLENLALRHQVQVLERGGKRPRLTNCDRTLWVVISQIWHGWRKSLITVQPETVIRWHRMGFHLY